MAKEEKLEDIKALGKDGENDKEFKPEIYIDGESKKADIKAFLGKETREQYVGNKLLI